MKPPRSYNYALALQDYLRRRENRNLLAQINAAQAEETEASGKTSVGNPNERIGGSSRTNGEARFGLVRN